MDLSDLIERNAAFAPDKVAIRFQGRAYTYAQFATRIAAAANALKSELGIGRGDRVAIVAANHPDYLVLLYACARLGAMLIPLNWRLATTEQIFILSDASAKALVIEQAFAGLIAPLKQVLREIRVIGIDFIGSDGAFNELLAAGSGAGRNPHIDFSCPVLVVYTSGTTGRPKGAVLRQEALVWNATMSHHMHALTSEDHVLSVLPLFHVGGLNIQTTPALQLGATVTIHPRFAADATLAAFADDHPTLVVLVPTTIQALIEHPAWEQAELTSLRAVTTGSTVVPPSLIHAFANRGVPVLQVYGSTETCPIAIYTRLGGDLSRINSTGLPGLHCDARVVDGRGCEVPHGKTGEIIVRGPNVFFEYWGDQAATGEALRDGWYHTGDVGTRDADGYFYVHDRKKNLIISGGENVYAAEVERVLQEHGAVLEAAVVGRPDRKWQEVPIAFVVLRKNVVVDAESLRRHVEGRLARFKVPSEIIFVESLPRNALGKVQHFLLKELAANTGAS